MSDCDVSEAAAGAGAGETRGPVAAILAAGRGSRLGSATDRLPKNMLAVGGRSILERQLEALGAAGFDRERIVVVSGHAADVLEQAHGEQVRLLHNPRWDVHNNLVSVWLLARAIPDDLLLINGDTLFHPGILSRLLAAPGEATLAVDDGGPLAEEQMKVMLADGRLVRIAKDLDPAASQGEYIGLARFRGAPLAALYEALGGMIEAGRTHEWYEGAFDRMADTVSIGTVSTAGLPWIEIDTPEDLAQAQTVAAQIDA